MGRLGRVGIEEGIFTLFPIPYSLFPGRSAITIYLKFTYKQSH
ncbi:MULTISPECIES: hypothetical protein [unclassified Moorena]|nr:MULTISPECIES: hypothetical protein [unclassified Moorena]